MEFACRMGHLPYTYFNLQWRIQGRGIHGAPLPTDQNVLNFMQFLGDPTNLYAGAPSYGESWIRPCFKIRLNEMMLQFEKSIKRNKKMVYV